MVTAGAAQPSTRRFPPRLDQYLSRDVKLSSVERSQLLAGAIVTTLLSGDDTKEVAVFGAVWIDAPMHAYAEAITDIEHFERGGGFVLTKRIGTPPTLEDFAQLHLSDEDIKALRSCRVGNCDVKLGAQALQRFGAIDWNAPSASKDANSLMQQLALEYVQGYLDGGNERLAVYRDKERPTFVAGEFRDMTGHMPELTAYMPNVRQYLLEYPKVSLPGATSFVYWQETDFGLKPTLRISHVTVLERPDSTVVASKMLYASHYFWTGLELRVLLPDSARGRGFWFVTVNRSRSDGLSGFTGRLLRGKVRAEVRDGAVAALRATKQRLESR
jgi:hypothetical protein